jgi:DNA-binding MarR family transcriptional regulator
MSYYDIMEIVPMKLKNMDFQALAEFRFEMRRFVNFSEQSARAAGLEPQHHQALLALTGLPGGERRTIGALAGRMQLRHNSAVELVDRLEARGLLHRIPSPFDGREVLLRLSSRGERVLEKLSRQHRAELQSAGPQLIRALQAVIRHAERRGERGAGKSPRDRRQNMKGRGAAHRVLQRRISLAPLR